MDLQITLQALLNIGVVGAVTSVFIEAINSHFSGSPAVSKAITVVLSLVVGSVYVWLQGTPYLATVATVLSSASLVYAFVYNKKQ